MAGGTWSISDRATSGSAATASQSAPAGYASGNAQVRLRALQCHLVGTSNATDRLVVRDGPTGTGTVIWSCDLSAASNTTAQVDLTQMDLRASPGNAITVEFVSGAGTAEDVNAQGDIVPQGYPYGSD